MKTVTKILITVQIFSGLMPLAACVFAAINQKKIMEMFHISTSTSPDLEKIIVILGAAMISGALFSFLAAGWIWKGKPEGYVLSLWVSVMLISASIYMLVFFSIHNINDPLFFVIDLIKGFLILALTIVAKRKTSIAS